MNRLMLAIRPGVWVAAVAMLVTGGIVAAPATTAMAASGCVTETFSIQDQNTVLQCVRDEQVLLNNVRGPFGLQQITVDGLYGPQTTSDVETFQKHAGITVDGITGPQTWRNLCFANLSLGFTGTFWHDAGCATL